jgi:DNA-directed RNA polymerase subunit N (RpoN/RPB10)
MIIPVRCFTCGKVLADKWKKYDEDCQEQANNDEEKNQSDSALADKRYFDGGHKGAILDRLGITKVCCRRHMLGHVDLVDIL